MKPFSLSIKIQVLTTFCQKRKNELKIQALDFNFTFCDKTQD